MTPLLRFVSHSIVAILLLACQARAEDPLPSVEKVRDLLLPSDRLVIIGEDGKPIVQDPLLKHGARLFPAYEAIIADPQSDRGIVENAFYVVAAVKGDRKRFLDLA